MAVRFQLSITCRAQESIATRRRDTADNRCDDWFDAALSRRNAVHHGLSAETVIDVLEDPEDYKAFELSVTSDLDTQTAVERELVLRLASLLWRLRRTTAIETGLLQIQAAILRDLKRGTAPARCNGSPQCPA